ncbi:MAG: D-2-hydroxyacid dehydrogenase, partial [Planctomycetes bacterium]|nr:D-2-hydroxyacid dehydrogenase [Planctomycetota bacterium]
MTDRIALYLPTGQELPGIEPRHLERLRRAEPGMVWEAFEDREAFLRALPASRAVAVWGFKAEWLERAPTLALISTPAAGRDWIQAEPRPGLAVRFGTFHGEFIGETVLGLMLCFCRGIKASLDRQAEEPWPRGAVAAGMRPLRGSTAVIVGFGNIGKWIGRLLRPLGVTVIGVNRTDLARPEYFTAADRVVPAADLETVLPGADHLVLA